MMRGGHSWRCSGPTLHRGAFCPCCRSEGHGVPSRGSSEAEYQSSRQPLHSSRASPCSALFSRAEGSSPSISAWKCSCNREGCIDTRICLCSLWFLSLLDSMFVLFFDLYARPQQCGIACIVHGP